MAVSSEIKNTVPPQAPDVEKAVLGAMINGKDVYQNIRHIISEESFYEGRHKVIFSAIKHLAEKETPIDIITLNNELENENNLEKIGGAVYLTELSLKVYTTANVEYHARILAEKQLQRFAIKIAKETEDKANKKGGDIIEELKNFQNSVDQLLSAANGIYAEDFEPLTLAKVIEEEVAESDGLETQYFIEDKDSNRYNLEIPAKQLTLIGAQTSHGKSRMLENLTIHFLNTCKENEVVLYYTFEESRNMVFEELLSIYTSETPLSQGRNIDTIRKYLKGNNKYVNAKANTSLFDALASRFDELQQQHLRIINKPYAVEQIIDNINFLVKKFGAAGKVIKVVMIDYVQLIRRMRESGNTKVDISYVMRTLQDFAVLKAKLPIILAAQLNRSAGSPLDLHNQNMADASDIEHNAGMVIMEWNSSFRAVTGSSWDKPESKKERERIEKMGLTLGCPGKMYILVTKWRGGPRNTDAVLKFNQNTGLIEGNSFSHTTPYINISSSTISDNVTPKEFG